MNNREFFKQAKFGMFIHWGLYSLPAGEWKGKRTEFPGEWIMTYNRIPVKEYEELAKVFKFNGITLAEKVTAKVQHKCASWLLKKILRKFYHALPEIARENKECDRKMRRYFVQKLPPK